MFPRLGNDHVLQERMANRNHVRLPMTCCFSSQLHTLLPDPRSPPSPLQADTKPGCVLRPANVVEVLQRRRNLLTNEDVESCKSGMNTWAFVGDLNDHPQLSCVYQSDDAQNEFLSNPKVRRLASRDGRRLSRADFLIHGNSFVTQGGDALPRRTCLQENYSPGNSITPCLLKPGEECFTVLDRMTAVHRKLAPPQFCDKMNQ